MDTTLTTMGAEKIREALGAWWAQAFPSEVMPTEALIRLSERLAAPVAEIATAVPPTGQLFVNIKEIAGAIAMWACRQSPYGIPDNLAEVLAHFYQAASSDFDVAVENAHSRWRFFNDGAALMDYVARALHGSGWERWNEAKVAPTPALQFVSACGGPHPDRDFIDLDALLMNVRLSIERATVRP